MFVKCFLQYLTCRRCFLVVVGTVVYCNKHKLWFCVLFCFVSKFCHLAVKRSYFAAQGIMESEKNRESLGVLRVMEII